MLYICVFGVKFSWCRILGLVIESIILNVNLIKLLLFFSKERPSSGGWTCSTELILWVRSRNRFLNVSSRFATIPLISKWQSVDRKRHYHIGTSHRSKHTSIALRKRCCECFIFRSCSHTPASGVNTAPQTLQESAWPKGLRPLVRKKVRLINRHTYINNSVMDMIIIHIRPSWQLTIVLIQIFLSIDTIMGI